MRLTYRQTACIYERLWDRKQWELEVQVKMNPFYSGGEKDENTQMIDLTDPRSVPPMDASQGKTPRMRIEV